MLYQPELALDQWVGRLQGLKRERQGGSPWEGDPREHPPNRQTRKTVKNPRGDRVVHWVEHLGELQEAQAHQEKLAAVLG